MPDPTTATADATVLRAADRAAWRAWLEAHAGDADEVWLVIGHARSATPSVTHREAVEEALCFGWIDSLTRRHDAESRRQRFSPRNPRSAWSKVNRELVARLTAEGRMAPAGLAAVELAERTGTWSLLAEAQDGIVPEDLRAALDADPAAARGFATLPPSARRAALETVARARRPDTRRRRIAHTVAAVSRGERP